MEPSVGAYVCDEICGFNVGPERPFEFWVITDVQQKPQNSGKNSSVNQDNEKMIEMIKNIFWVLPCKKIYQK